MGFKSPTCILLRYVFLSPYGTTATSDIEQLCVVLGAAATVLASPFDRLHLHKKARSTKVVTLTSIVTPVEAESPTAYSSASNTSVSVNPYGTWNVSDTTTSTTAGALLETSAEATPSSTGLSVAITTASDGMVNAVAQRPSTVTRVTTTTLTYTMGAGATTTVKTTEYEHTITEWATEVCNLSPTLRALLTKTVHHDLLDQLAARSGDKCSCCTGR